MWKYYDFGANWDAFYDVWKRPHVQDGLFEEVSEKYTNSGWKRGDDLWSLTNHWFEKAHKLATKEMEDYNMISNYKKTMQQHFPRKTLSEDWMLSFYNVCYTDVLQRHFPKPKTMQSLVVVPSDYRHKQCMTGALFDVAIELFQEEDAYVIEVSGLEVDDLKIDSVVLVYEQKIVFDLVGYYMHTIEKDEDYKLMPDRVYDIMCYLEMIGDDI